MRSLTFWLLATLSITLTAQENIEQYLINDSLEIESLVARDVLLDMEDEGPSVTVYTSFGLLGKQLNKLSDLNSALLANGYGEIPETSLAGSLATGLISGNIFPLGQPSLATFYLTAPKKTFPIPAILHI